MRKFTVYETLAEIQLIRLIEKGKNVDECKSEWKRRWGVDYPNRKR